MNTVQSQLIVVALALTLLAGLPATARQTAPVILAQPTNEIVLAGSIATFSVSVSGTGPLTYQWQFNGTNLPGIITTVAGNGTHGYSGDNGGSTNAELDGPVGIVTDNGGNLFIADEYNYRIRRVGANGIISTVAGNGLNGPSGDGGEATNASLFYPNGIAVDGSGNMFIAGDGGGFVRKVGANGTITTVAGGIAAYGIVVDSLGNLFIADSLGNRVRMIDLNGTVVAIAGNGTAGYSGDGGGATDASLNSPAAVALGRSGDIFIADEGNNRIRKVDTNGIISTLAGNGTASFSGDGGAATNASLYYPQSVAVDAVGNIFIADSSNHRIREVLRNGIISTVAGNGPGLFSGDGGPATEAILSRPSGVTFDAYGNLLIADPNFQRVRQVSAQGPSFVLNSVNPSNAGDYDLVVTSPFGSVTSSVVSLTVALPSLNASVVAGSGVLLQFRGIPGSSYVLLSANSLTLPISSWSPVITNVADVNGFVSFTDTNVASSVARFYRMTTAGP